CINCAAIPENIMESELFGYESGAFTSAKNNGKLGKLEMANNGTVFLDEIGDMSPTMQAKLLRFLQEGELEKVGSVKPVSVDVRVICATNRDIKKMVEDGIFRADLYYRLSSIVMEIPPLRERPEDVEILCDHYLKNITEKWKIPLKRIESEALEAMRHYYWPGNVRELLHLLEKLCCVADGNVIKLKHLPPYLLGESTFANTKKDGLRHTNNEVNDRNIDDSCSKVLIDKERELLEKVLVNTGGNKRKAAEILGIHRTTLYYKLRKHNLKCNAN
ncbi:MAG: sigma 54-interacting transcriptional regulator, partial [Peptococcaceae bacterium]|nr:sigma 54-interacting transcriptional regulator [Peptococcaceae bacterium]